jgi:hypothetical protein
MPENIAEIANTSTLRPVHVVAEEGSRWLFSRRPSASRPSGVRVNRYSSPTDSSTQASVR